MRNFIVSIVLVLLVLGGCGQQNNETPSKIKMKAESENWIVQVEYIKEGSHYVEIPYITYLGKSIINSAWLDITYKRGSFTRNHIQLPKELNNHEQIKLVTRSEIKPPPVDSEYAIIKWENGGEEVTETLDLVTIEME
jgi:hypothetical protein